MAQMQMLNGSATHLIHRRHGKLVKPNNKFALTVRDIEIIEQALRAKAGRRGIQISQGNTSEQLKQELDEIQELLGRIHSQKVFYRPSTKTYVSG